MARRSRFSTWWHSYVVVRILTYVFIALGVYVIFGFRFPVGILGADIVLCGAPSYNGIISATYGVTYVNMGHLSSYSRNNWNPISWVLGNPGERLCEMATHDPRFRMVSELDSWSVMYDAEQDVFYEVNDPGYGSEEPMPDGVVSRAVLDVIDTSGITNRYDKHVLIDAVHLWGNAWALSYDDGLMIVDNDKIVLDEPDGSFYAHEGHGYVRNIAPYCDTSETVSIVGCREDDVEEMFRFRESGVTDERATSPIAAREASTDDDFENVGEVSSSSSIVYDAPEEGHLAYVSETSDISFAEDEIRVVAHVTFDVVYPEHAPVGIEPTVCGKKLTMISYKDNPRNVATYSFILPNEGWCITCEDGGTEFVGKEKLVEDLTTDVEQAKASVFG